MELQKTQTRERTIFEAVPTENFPQIIVRYEVRKAENAQDKTSSRKSGQTNAHRKIQKNQRKIIS